MLVGRDRREREREENPRKGRASTTTTSNKKGRKRDRKKIEAWLKARRVLTMADDFQLLLSPSREWKMENPNAGYIHIYIYLHWTHLLWKFLESLLASLFTRVYCFLRLLFILRRDIPASWIERETHSCQLSMEISRILQIKGLHAIDSKRRIEM